MITAKGIKDARDFLTDQWGDNGIRLISECENIQKFNGKSRDFLDHCTACGGNWGAMLLSGIKDLWPSVWDIIPDEMGLFSFTCICNVLILCGVDTSE